MGYVLDVLTLTAVMVIAVHGYMLIKGLGGLLHLGHPVFYGLGAYTSAILATKVLPDGAFVLSLLAGILVAAGGAVIVGWPALRDRGRFFMIVTFAIQLIFVTLVINMGFTGGPDGITSIPRISLGPWQLASKTTLDLGLFRLGVNEINLIFITAMACLSFWFCTRVVRSPYGRLVRATRDDELAVEAYGRQPARVKLSIFAIGAGITGAAGSIFAHYFNYVGPFQFELDLVVLFLVMLVLGGQRNLVGATVGAAATIALLEFLRFFLENVVSVPFEVTAHMREVVFSILLIVLLVIRPNGLLRERLVRYARPAECPRPAPAVAADTAAGPAASAPAAAAIRVLEHGAPAAGPVPARYPVLSCRGLVKNFGGLRAVDGCDLELRRRSIVSIIGPNGAGKTSVFNLISGFVKPDAGRVFLGDLEITGTDSATIARLGVARTFQDVRIWPDLTAIENVLATFPGQIGENPVNGFFRPRAVRAQEAENIARAWDLLDRFEIAGKANDLAGELSYAQKKMLALARMAAYRPSTILLDEPTAGVDIRRLDHFFDRIRAFVDEDGCSVCLIEHNMQVVRELADWVYFMEDGKVIAGGEPDDVLGNRDLMTIYLGQGGEAFVNA